MIENTKYDPDKLKLRFVYTGGPIAWSIRRAQLGWWASHVDVIMPDGSFLGAHFWDGVKKRKPGYDAGGRTIEKVVSIPVGMTDPDYVYSFLEKQVGKPYDRAAIFTLATGIPVENRNWKDDDSWFCSEVVAAPLETAGPIILPSYPRFVTPRDLGFSLTQYVGYHQ